MIISKDVCTLFDPSIINEDELPKGIIPDYLEEQIVLRGIIHNIQEQKRDGFYEIAGLFKCLSSSDEEDVREAALAAICNLCDKKEKLLAIAIASFDDNENVLSTMLEEANDLEPNIFKPIAKRFINHESDFISDYAQGMLDRKG